MTRRTRRTRRRGGGGGEEDERRTRQEEEEATDIKSNNPHLAGGEKQNRSKPLAKYTEHVAKNWISKLSPNIKFEVLFRKTEISNFKIDPIPFKI